MNKINSKAISFICVINFLFTRRRTKRFILLIKGQINGAKIHKQNNLAKRRKFPFLLVLHQEKFCKLRDEKRYAILVRHLFSHWLLLQNKIVFVIISKKKKQLVTLHKVNTCMHTMMGFVFVFFIDEQRQTFEHTFDQEMQ